MKKSLMIPCVLGAVGIGAYLYMQTNPKMICDMKHLLRELLKETYQRLDDIN